MLRLTPQPYGICPEQTHAWWKLDRLHQARASPQQCRKQDYRLIGLVPQSEERDVEGLVGQMVHAADAVAQPFQPSDCAQFHRARHHFVRLNNLLTKGGQLDMHLTCSLLSLHPPPSGCYTSCQSARMLQDAGRHRPHSAIWACRARPACVRCAPGQSPAAQHSGAPPSLAGRSMPGAALPQGLWPRAPPETGPAPLTP